MEQTKIEIYLKEKLQTVPLENFIKQLPVKKLLEDEENELEQALEMSDDDETL